jgi:toxin ParE1/3/4
VRKPRLLRTAQAEEDLVDIWNHIARDNPAAADRLLDVLDEKSQALAHNPLIGKARDDIAAGVRHFPVERYLILYRDIGDGVEGSALCSRHAPPARFVIANSQPFPWYASCALRSFSRRKLRQVDNLVHTHGAERRRTAIPQTPPGDSPVRTAAR